jgi:leader peptidase (prepilin peptidase)/N-methyltransferase
MGSFVLAYVDRSKSKRNWVSGRSECEYCKHKLSVVDLIPIISWLSTAGKCRYCRKSLSFSYPLTEFAMALLFIGSYLFWPVELDSFSAIAQLVIWLVALVPLMALVIYDLRWFLLPTNIIRILIVLGIVWVIIDVANASNLILSIILTFAAIGLGAGFFLLLLLFSKGKWIGDGDVRLAVAMGLFIGNPVGVWMAIFVASVAGIIASIPLLFKSKSIKKQLKLKIPFGPMLIFALYLVVLFGDRIIDWYETTFILL